MLNPSSFYSVLAPMYSATKMLGLVPFSINSNNCKHSKISLVWSVFFMLFLNIYAFVGIDYNFGINYEFIAVVTGFLDVYLGQGSMCCGILFGCIFRNDIVTILQDIKIFDNNMQNCLHVDLKKEYRKSKMYSILALIVSVTISAAAVTFTTIGSTDLFTFELFGEFLGYTGPFLISVFVDLQFCTLLLCLKQRFGWLNKKIIAVSKNLEIHLRECDILIQATKVNPRRPATHAVATGFIQDRALYFIETIKSNHYILCSISKTLNKAYSVQILLIILQNFITIIASLYYSGKYVLIDNVIPIDYLIYSGLQLTLATGQILALVISCSSTALEAQKMGILIHKIMSLNGKVENKCKEELQLEVTLFSLQLIHHNVEFTACKIFIMNETLIFSIVGAITTYLVIVIQFEVANLQHGGGKNTTF